MNYTNLISLDALKNINNVKILDCRAALGDREHGRRVFAEGHIPSAGYLSLDDDLADPPGEGGRHPLPATEALAGRLRELAINDESQVVVYDDAGGAYAARAWWCLRWLGHAAVAVLDGGLAVWDGELETRMPAKPPGNFTIRPSLTRTVDVAQLSADLHAAHLIDARSEPRFAGIEEPIDAIAGHIPGASCLPFQGNLGTDGRFLRPAQLKARFSQFEGEAVVCYCGSGVTAAHNILALNVAGFPEPALYPGSWSQWIRNPDRPIAVSDPASEPDDG
jgi:thiosulfate/3-mercaptopyruvate sulfurtransferase